MENANHEEVRQWVLQQAAYLDPPAGWNPDSRPALARFHESVEKAARSRAIWWRWAAWAVALALVIAGILVLPEGRAAAQQIWQFLTVRRVAFIRVKGWPEGVRSPQVALIGTPLPPLPARDLDDARWRVHYDPRLPRPGVLSGSPRLYTTFSLSAGTVVQAADLELALRKAGITDQSVPPQWDGAKLAVHTSPIVIAEWPDVVLTQSLPLTLSAPDGFDFPAYSALVLRVLGVPPTDAQRFAEHAGTAPPWLAPLASDFNQRALIEEITLNSGPATLMDAPAADGAFRRITIMWSVPDRVYLLSGNVSRELAIAAAGAVE